MTEESWANIYQKIPTQAAFGKLPGFDDGSDN